MTISIHAPRAGSDYGGEPDQGDCLEFQSTLPVRGATRPSVVIALFSAFQSTLPVRGATKRVLLCGAPGDISIHAPRAGSDMAGSQIRAIALNFNPRSPCGERPPPAARERRGPHFNPRSPCGERLRQALAGYFTKEFQSTLPVRGATLDSVFVAVRLSRFQSTLPVRGATFMPRKGVKPMSQFQSTLPVRGAT